MKRYYVWQTVGVEVYAEEQEDYEFSETIIEKALEIPLQDWNMRCDTGIEVYTND